MPFVAPEEEVVTGFTAPDDEVVKGFNAPADDVKAILQAQMASLSHTGNMLDALTTGTEGAEQLAKGLAEMPATLLNQPTRIVGAISRAAGGPTVPDLYAPNKPIVQIPEPSGTGVLAGLGQLAARTVSGFTTPENIVSLPAAGTSATVRALFGASMAGQLPAGVQNAVQTAEDPAATTADKVVAVGEPLVGTALAGYLVGHENAGLRPALPPGSKVATPAAPPEDDWLPPNPPEPVQTSGQPAEAAPPPETGGIPLGKVSIDPTRVQELMDTGLSKAEAINQAASETAVSGIDESAAQPGPSTDPVPETPETLAAQVALTADDSSSKAATHVTPGAEMPEVPEGLITVPVLDDQGMVIVNPTKADPNTVAAAAATGDHGEYLGMGSTSKPSGGEHVLQTRDANGTVVQDEVVTPATMDKAYDAARAAVPGGTSEVKLADQVIQERRQARTNTDQGPSRILVKALNEALESREPIPASLIDDYNAASDTPFALQDYQRKGNEFVYIPPKEKLSPAQQMARENVETMRRMRESKGNEETSPNYNLAILSGDGKYAYVSELGKPETTIQVSANTPADLIKVLGKKYKLSPTPNEAVYKSFDAANKEFEAARPTERVQPGVESELGERPRDILDYLGENYRQGVKISNPADYGGYLKTARGAAKAMMSMSRGERADRILQLMHSEGVYRRLENEDDLLNAMQRAGEARIEFKAEQRRRTLAKLDKLKVNTKGQLHAFGLLPEVWNTLVDGVKLAVKGGMALADAVNYALERFNREHHEVSDRVRFEAAADKLLKVTRSNAEAPSNKTEATSWWQKNGDKELTRPDLGLKATISQASINKITSGDKPFPQARMAMVRHLPELFAAAHDTIRRPDDGRDPQVARIIELHAPFEHNGTLYRARLLVKEFKPESGKPTKLHSGRIEDVVLEKENGARLDRPAGDASKDAVPSAASPDTAITLRQLFNGRNPFQDAPQFDEAGARAWFAKQGVRQFGDQLQGSTDISDALKGQAANTLYTKRPQETDAQLASRMVTSYGGPDGARLAFQNRSNDMPASVRMALGMQILKSYDAAGRLEDAASFLDNYFAPHTTDVAQGLAMLNAWSSMSKEGKIVWAQKKINDAAQDTMAPIRPDLEAAKTELQRLNAQGIEHAAADPAVQRDAKAGITEAAATSPETHNGIVMELTQPWASSKVILDMARQAVHAKANELLNTAPRPIQFTPAQHLRTILDDLAKRAAEIAAGHYQGAEPGVVLRDKLMQRLGLSKEAATKFAIALDKEFAKQVEAAEKALPERIAKQAVAKAKAPERTADQILSSFATSQSDTLAWKGKGVPDPIRVAVATQLARRELSDADFTSKLEGLGVEGPTARSLASVVRREMNIRDSVKRAQKGEEPNPETKAAEALVGQFAKSQSDTLEWTPTKTDTVRAAVKDQLTNRSLSDTDFAAKLQSLGVEASAADRLSKVVRREIGIRDLVRSTREDRQPNAAARSAKSLIGQFAKTQSDTLDFGKAKLDPVKAAVREQLRGRGLSDEDFVAKLRSLGVSEADAAHLGSVVRREMDIQDTGASNGLDHPLDLLLRKQLSDAKIKLGQLVRDHYTKVDATKADLVDTLVNQAGLSGLAAERLAGTLRRRLDVLTGAAKQAALGKLLKAVNKQKLAKPELVQKLLGLTHLGAFDDATYYNMVKEQLKLPEWTPTLRNELSTLADQIAKVPESQLEEAQRRQTDFMNALERAKGISNLDLSLAFYLGNILSGVTTHARVAIHTSAQMVAATTAEMEQALVEGRLHDIPLIFQALAKGFGKAATQTKDVMRTGMVVGSKLQKVVPLNVLEQIQFGRAGGTTAKQGPIAKALLENRAAGLLNLWKYNSRLITAQHMVYFKPAEEMKVAMLAARQARTEGLTGKAATDRARQILGYGAAQVRAAEAQALREGFEGTKGKMRVGEILNQAIPAEMRDNARDYALRQTFLNDPYGFAGAVANIVASAKNSENVKLATAARVIVPFTRIAANLFNEGLNYTPVGALRAGIAKTQLLGQKFADITPEVRNDLQKELYAKSALGTMLITGIALKAGTGLDNPNPNFTVYGQGPANPDDKAAWRAAGGIPYSVKVGNRYVSYANTPGNVAMATLGNYLDGARDAALYKRPGALRLSQDLPMRAAAATLGAGKVIMEQPFLQSLMDIAAMTGENNPEVSAKQAVKTAARTASSFVIPNLLRQADKFFDPTAYQQSDISGILTSQVPFLRQTGKPMLNALGQPIKSPVFGMFTAPRTEDPLTEMLVDHNNWPSMPDRNKTNVNGVPLTDDQFYQYVQARGLALRDYLDKPGVADILTHLEQQAASLQAMATANPNPIGKAKQQALAGSLPKLLMQRYEEAANKKAAGEVIRQREY